MPTQKSVNHKSIISLSNVGVAYRLYQGRFKSKLYWALKDISFEIYQGETLGVIGRNGAGKSTLLKLLAGIIRPDVGKIKADNLTVSLLALQLGFIQHLSGRENAVLSGMLLGIKRKEIEAKLPEIIAFAELGEFINQPVRTYSAGMKARLGFSVAVIADPDVLLIDEVLGVGDAAFKEKSTAVMQQRLRSNKTIVLVSHGLPTIRESSQRAVWIDEGLVRAYGEVEEVIKQYQKAAHKQTLASKQIKK